MLSIAVLATFLSQGAWEIMAPATKCTCTNDLACSSYRMAQVATTANVDDIAYKVRDFAHTTNGVNHVWDGNCASYETHTTNNMPAIHHMPGQNKWGDKCAYITPGQSSLLINNNNACGSYAPAGWARICCCARTGKNGGGTGPSRAEDCPLNQNDCPAGTTYAHGFCGAATNAPTTAPTTSAPTSSPTTSAPVVPSVNGGYTAWGACSVACGGGTKTRLCSNPTPVGTGADCSGLGVASQPCNPTACTGAPTTAPSNVLTTVPRSNAPTTAPTTAPLTFAPTTAPIAVRGNSAAAEGTEANAGATVGIVFGIIGGILVLAIVTAAVAMIVFILFKVKDAKKKGDDDDESPVDLSLEMGSMASASSPASFGGKLQKQASRFIGGNPMSAQKDFGIGGIDAEIKAEAREIVAASGIITGAAACTSVMGSNPMKRAADFGIGGESVHSSDSLSLSGDEDIEAPPAVQQQQQQQQQATTEKKSRPISMRVDVDGTKYSKEEFQAHYGGSEDEWNQAKRTTGGGDDEDNEEAKKAARPVSMRTSMVREEAFANALAGFGDDEDDGDQVVAESLAPVVEEEEPMFAPPPAPPAAAATASGETMFSFGGEDEDPSDEEIFF